MNIHTERCLIRRFQEQDIADFMVYRNDMEWMKYQGFKGLTKQEYCDVLLGEHNVQAGVQLAVIALLKDKGVTCMKAGVDRDNEASISFIQKLNFCYAGMDGDEQIFVLQL